MEPAAVGDGLAALDALWDAVAAGRPYALVLLDARMPDTDGLALAAKIRKRAELAATRIILLTSGERPGDWDQIRERRIDAQLLKPAQQDRAPRDDLPRDEPGQRPPHRRRPVPWEGGNRPRRRYRPRRRCTSWWLRTTRSTRNFSSDFSSDAAVACALANNGRDAGPGGRGRIRPHAAGCPDAGAGRLPGRSGGSRAGAVHRGPPARHRLDGALASRRPRSVPPAGMDDFLTKPIQAADLWTATEKVTGSRPPSERSRAGPARPACAAGRLRGRCSHSEEDLSGASGSPTRPFDGGSGCPAGAGRDAAGRSCPQTSWDGGGVFHGGRCRGIGSRRSYDAWPARRGLAFGGTARSKGAELIQQVEGVSIEALRDQTGAAGDRVRTASP